MTEGIVSNLRQRGASAGGSNLRDLISIESPVNGNVGVGFAIPINPVKQQLAALEGGSSL